MLHKRTLPITANLEEEAQESDILVDVVSKPKDPKAFPGLYPSTVPRLLVECQPYLVIESAWRSRTTIVAVNVKDGSIHDLGNAQGINQTASHRLMATDGKSRILAIKTSLISPPKLLLGSFTSESTNSDPEIQWTIVKEWVYDFVNNDEIAFSHEKLHSTVIPLPGWNGTEALVVSPQPLDKVPTLPQNHVQALCVGKTAQADSASTVIPPLIMFAHGGPCSVFTSVWNLMSCLAW